MTTTTSFAVPERSAPLTDLSEGALGELRLREPDALRKLEQSLRRHGQLEPLIVFAEDGLLEVLDLGRSPRLTRLCSGELNRSGDRVIRRVPNPW